jgi:Flp pilus assembly protein TadD
MHRWVACVSLVLFAATAFSSAPTLVVPGDDGNVALELSAASIRVTVRGHLARTSHELTYRSSLDRDTGGEFTFPLPPNAEVSDLGLWIDGKLRHGVAVERVLARTAYDEVVHRSVDPALAEWNDGRSFSLNLYPIPANGEKKVLIAYDQELTSDDYTLDVSYRNTVASFDVKIDSDGAAVFEKNGVIHIERDPRQTAFNARSSEDGMWYASAAIDVTPAEREAAPAPHTVIFYDTSFSSEKQDSALLRRFLGGFLASQQAWSTAEVFPFHVDIDAPREIHNAGSPGGTRELERILGDLQPLGATNLIAVATRLPKITAAYPPGTRIVLVTDGLTSLGDSRSVAAAVSKLSAMNRPLLVVHATETANDDLLANAARVTGGWSIDLRRTDVDTAIDAAMHLPSMTRLSGPEIAPSSLLASRATRFAIAARAKAAITTLRDLPLRELHSDVEKSLVRRAWARAKLREMLATGAPDDDLLAHGLAFTQLTPRTSLLVLERWWDYVQWNIPMPPDLIEEKERYEKEQAAEAARRNLPLPPPSVIHGGWTIHGRVLDSTGVPIPGVRVMLLDGEVAIAGAITDADGAYAVGSPVAPQNPFIVADLEGFDLTRRAVSGSGVVDLSLHLSAVAESITVTAAAPQVLETSAVSSALRTQVLSDDALEDPELAEAAVKQRRGLTRTIIERMREIPSTAERLRYYLNARKLLAGDKGFHVFAAEVFRAQSPELAARVLSDLAETRDNQAPLLRILARVLDGWGEESLARLLLERAIEVSPTEPQSWREMILLEARHGRASSVTSWSRRLAAGKKRDWMDAVYTQTSDALARWDKASFFDRQRGADLRFDEKDDLSIELMFDTGWAWVDLHVTEPGGERVSWDHIASKSGAKFTGGYTFGYGPEIYTLPKAPRGTYRLAIDYYADDETRVSLETLVHVIVHHRGRRAEHFFVLGEERENFEFTTIEMQ